MKSKLSVLVGVISLVAVTPAFADASSASVLTSLFLEACLPNVGQPEKVRAWATEHHLPQLQNQAALNLFVGPGREGEAWAVPSHAGQFALSIQGKPICAVFARSADPDEVRANVAKLMDRVKRPGSAISTVKDDTRATRWGQAHESIYSVPAPHGPVSFVFGLMTSDKAGGPIQASILVEETLSASR
jgi:hypothetical protein